MFYLLLFFVVAFVVAIVFLSIIAFVLRLVGFLDLLLTCAHKCPVGMTNVALRICMYVLVESQLLISNLRSSQENFTGGTLNKLPQVSACLPPPRPSPTLLRLALDSTSTSKLFNYNCCINSCVYADFVFKRVSLFIRAIKTSNTTKKKRHENATQHSKNRSARDSGGSFIVKGSITKAAVDVKSTS